MRQAITSSQYSHNVSAGNYGALYVPPTAEDPRTHNQSCKSGLERFLAKFPNWSAQGVNTKSEKGGVKDGASNSA